MSSGHEPIPTRPAPGFAGIWYGNQPTDPPYHWKYSGGLATYPQQHAPIAIHHARVNRTYFVFGGAGEQPATADYRPQGREAPGTTACCISYFDHATGTLARPVELLVRDVIDAHENPVLCIDEKGHLLVFCPAHGSRRPSDILRSRRPHDIGAWDRVARFAPGENFSYPQPWWITGQGVVFLHTFYEDGKRRRLGVTVSPDGIDWSAWPEKQFLSKMAEGSYQVSWPDPKRGVIGTAFDMHPPTEGDHPLNRRTNLYYAQSHDGGRTWTTAAGEPLALPLVETDNPARVFDGASAGVLVYLKDVQFDANGWPVVLYLTSTSAWPWPEGGPHRWYIAAFDGKAWSHQPITTSDHNYDHGSLLLRADGDWRLIAPTEPGPQTFATGGAIALWRSRDRGRAWVKQRVLVNDPAHNHTYARRPLNAHDGFAMLWAAADAHHPSCSSLHFCDVDGAVWRMPVAVDQDFVEPVRV